MGRGRMNAIRAIQPYRHEGFWVFDEGQRSAVSVQRRHTEPEEGCRVCSPTTRWSRGGCERGHRHGKANWWVLFGANVSTPCYRVAGASSKHS